eukprot:CAMPEP_0170483432 /NCGR_PEP_ID=MMETSP0208-20121228/3100_1 /TAXON_ID=197538 /ORGANISM="Strombidium inclinatum, Strain S3" /LENGTH=52 /DNA_ID=CAMNT_0010756455 /DNA_START=8422 /DNA_END=8580 /DNA_ORIENTATION=-
MAGRVEASASLAVAVADFVEAEASWVGAAASSPWGAVEQAAEVAAVACSGLE